MTSHTSTIENDERTRSAEQAAAAERAALAEGAVPIDFFHLFWIFTIVSVVGLFAETVVSYPIDGIWKNRAGLIWGPFSPIYGVGAVLMTIFLGRARHTSAMGLFISASLLGGAFELFAGYFWERAFGFVAWSYADQPFNIGGYTCLGIALCWGVLGVVWVKLLLPSVINVIDLIPLKARKIATGIMCTFLAADIAMTFVGFACWFNRDAGKPIDNPVEEYFAATYPDSYMESQFQTISMYPELASRR